MAFPFWQSSGPLILPSIELPLPSRLTPTAFESYQYWETQPGHSNQITAVVDFRGPLRTDVLSQALGRLRERHPMLTARMVLDSQRPVAWESGGSDRLPLILQPHTEGFDPDTLPASPTIDPAGDLTGCLTVRYGPGQCQWVLQTHHAACDGVGGMQAIRELIQDYHHHSVGTEWQPRPLSDQRLVERGRWRREGSWWQLPLQSIALFGASKFLLRPIVALESELPVPPSGDAVNEPPNGCCQLTLSESQTGRVRQLARQAGVTVNSLIMAYWMIALDQWVVGHQNVRDRSWYRLVVPTNERTAADTRLSACNRVSLVYVDRRKRELEHAEALMHGIHYEMGVMRRLRLTRTLLVALRGMQWVPGLLRRHAQTPRCWATSYVTNLGGVMNRLDLPVNSSGETTAGELTLERIRLLPPLRPGTPLALAVHQYAGRLNFSLHYRPHDDLLSSDAAWILSRLGHRLKTLS